jgi:hypothetical protein
MKSLIRKEDWLKVVVREDELNNWNQDAQECCTPQQFRLHLLGTPSHPWNNSAIRVFAGDFLATHSDTYPDVWAVRRMVLKKTHAYVKSLIKAYRAGANGGELQRITRIAKNRRERKSNVSLSPQISGILVQLNVAFEALPPPSRYNFYLSPDGTTATDVRSPGYRRHVQ